MTPAEIRAIAYAAAAFVLIAIGVAAGMRHVQAQWNIDKLAQSAALTKQLEANADLAKQRDALQSQVDQSHAQILSNGSALSANLANSVRAVEAALRSRPVPGAMVNTSGLQVAVPSSGIDAELAASIGSINSALAGLTASCVKVDADRTSIIALEPKH